jgi:hypothetical protein
VTSLKDIQALIADIDSILPKSDARLPWSKLGDVARERQVLERVRSYLVSQQQNFNATAPESPRPTTPAQQQQVVQQIVQTVTQEVNERLTDLLQPLHSDVEALRQQREALVQEIRQLEQKRQQIDLLNQRGAVQQQMISEFSQRLIHRCTESLTQQLAQILANFEASLVHAPSTQLPLNPLASHSALAPADSDLNFFGPGMQPPGTSEQMRQLQEQSDQMLTTLDANQRAIFEALQSNLHAYQESLSQGLERMHSLGVQGEMLFTTWMNRLAQPLASDASSSPPSPLQKRSDSASPTPGTSVSFTPPQTLLPSDTICRTEYLPSPGVVRGGQIPLQPPTVQAAPLTQPQSTRDDGIHTFTPEEQDAIPQTTQLPLTPQADSSAEAPKLPTASETGANALTESPSQPSVSSSSNRGLENLNAEDWELIEGLDSDDLNLAFADDGEFDTFIQLDIDESALLPPLEELGTLSPPTSQEPDFLLRGVNQQQPGIASPEENTPTTASEKTGIGDSDILADLNLLAERVSAEIDDLYQSLFGTDTLTNVAKLDASDLLGAVDSEFKEPMQASEEVHPPNPDSMASFDAATPLSPQAEDILFDGLAASDTEFPQTNPLIAAEGELAETWEALFGEEAEPPLLNSTDVASDSDSQFNGHSPREREDIKTIAALTDLFEEMGLSSSPSTPVSQPIEHPISDTPAEGSWIEDTYIPASPEENLLETASLDSDSDRDIRLDQDTLQQLQQDLSSFEHSSSQNPPRQEEQRFVSFERDEPPIEPDTAQFNQPHEPFPSWQELLAEDWDDFILKESDSQHDSANAAAPTAAESLPSDFDPDLFPSEALELNHESSVNADATISQELTRPGELIAFEDDNFVEMQWDEPTDSTTEEAMAKQEEQQDAQRLEHWERENTSVTEQTSVAPSAEGLPQDVASDSLKQETQGSEASNFDVNFPKPEVVNPEQPDQPKKNNPDSTSQA